MIIDNKLNQLSLTCYRMDVISIIVIIIISIIKYISFKSIYYIINITAETSIHMLFFHIINNYDFMFLYR